MISRVRAGSATVDSLLSARTSDAGLAYLKAPWWRADEFIWHITERREESHDRTVETIPVTDNRQYNALFDPATGLPGAVLLVDRLDVALARASRPKREVAVIVLAQLRLADGALWMNLRTVADRLRRVLRSDDTIARLDGQTLVIVANEVRGQAEADLIAERLLANGGIVCDINITMSSGCRGSFELLAKSLGAIPSMRAA